MNRILPIAVALALASGCATHKSQPAIIAVGKSLAALQPEFEATSDTFVLLCDQRILAVTTCDAYHDFAVRFQAAYPLAAHAWDLASADAGTFDTAAWADLVAQLAQFTIIAVHAVHDAQVGATTMTDGGTP